MSRFGIPGLLISAVVLLAAESSWAQPAPQPTTYKLTGLSDFERGCFPPCLCPIMVGTDLVGTFDLVFDRFDGLFWHYDVTDVNWTATLLGAPWLPISGAGSYRVGGEFASMHQLELDLTVGTEPVEHFDSGLIVGGGTFPTIDLVISINGIWCFDTVMTVHANPLGDINGDGLVDQADRLLFVDVLLGVDSDPDHVAAADLNLDGAANGADVPAFVKALTRG